MSWYARQITASSQGWQEGYDDTFGDVQRYLYDAYTARVYITKIADKKITVSVGLYHLQEGTCMYQDWWRFSPDEEGKARRVWNEVKAEVDKVFEDFKTNNMPNPLLHTHIREATRFIAPENKPSSRVPLVDYARSLTCVTDWRQTLYPNRYPESDGF